MLFVHHGRLDCVLREKKKNGLNELKKTEGERGESRSATGTQEASSGLVYRRALTFKGKGVRLQFP